ncbi:MAG: hypothetical protein HQ483_19395 [Rhodospirillales bacterium]|nr:hypothetical protein [Rhodospirillales bacterium]
MRLLHNPSDVWKLRLIAIWCILLVIGYTAATIFMADILHDEKDLAIARHEARVTKVEVDTGLSDAETEAFNAQNKSENIVVSSGMYIDRIFDVDLPMSHWKVDFYIWFNWDGPNVHPGDNFHIINGKILDKELKTKTSVNRGEVVQNYELYRVVAEITKFFNISRYPRDDHLMTILVEDTKRQAFDLTYLPDEKGSDVSSRVKLPGYEIYSREVIEKGHAYRTRRGDPRLPENYKANFSQLTFGIGIKRASWGLYLKMFVGIFAAVAFSMLAFFVSPAHTSPRFGIGVGAFFASIASIYVISSQIPLSSTYTLTDFVTVSSVVTIFLTLLSSTRSVYMHHHWSDGDTWAWRFDRVVQILFVTCYTVLNITLAASASL